MRCRRRNEEELFGGGGQSLTVLLRNHHIKAHRVLTWRESPVSLQSNAGPATAILLQHDHHATTHGSPNPKSSVAKHQEAHQDLLGRGRLQTALVQTRHLSKHAWCCGPAQSSELPLASGCKAGARTDPCSRCFKVQSMYTHQYRVTIDSRRSSRSAVRLLTRFCGLLWTSYEFSGKRRVCLATDCLFYNRQRHRSLGMVK